MAKYSLCIEAVLDGEVDFYDRIQVAKDLGFDAVEFWDPVGKDTAKIAKLSAQHNIPVAACCVQNAWNDLYRMSEDPARVLQNVTESAKIAKDMGCPTMIGLSGDVKGHAYDETVALIGNLKKCAEVLEKEGVTLMHVRSRAPAWSVRRASRLSGVPFVSTWHGLYGTEPKWLKIPYNRVMLSGAATIAVSDCVRNHILSVYGADPAKVVRIHRGADVATFRPDAVPPERAAAYALSFMAASAISANVIAPSAACSGARSG